MALFAPLLVCAQQWPPATPEAKAGTRWWWLGSAVDEANLQWNMQEYARHGLGTLEITPIYGVKGNDANNVSFLSPKWMQLLQFIQSEAKRDGLQVNMNCGTGWPFGGPEVPLEEAACKVIFIDTLVNSDQLVNLNLAVNEKERPYSTLSTVMAFSVDVAKYKAKGAVKAGNVVSMVDDNGFLHWRNAEKGTWRIIALYVSRTRQKVKRAAPGGEGWVIDHFDSTAVKHYLERFDRAFQQLGTPYPDVFFNDSYEVYGANWTPSLLNEFEKRRGYKLEYKLPQLLDGDADVVSDYRETLSDLLLQNFTEQWAAWAHSHGAKVRNQAHGSPANLIDVYAAVDIPEIEGFGLSEFGIKGLRKDPGFTRKNFSDLSMLKYASSAAHITGKPLTSSETFTWLTEHFRTSLSQMKPDLDLMFCSGVNRVFFHGTCYSPKDDPWPGWKFYASIDMSPTNSIWRDAPALMSYIERSQRFLQWGKPDNDFLVYVPVRDMWRRDTQNLLMQFDIHKMEQKAPDFIQSVLTIDKLGFDCDYISERYLLSTTFDGEKLRTAAGTTYKALVIPGDYVITDRMKQYLDELKKQGAQVIMGIKEAEMARVAKAEPLKSVSGLNLIRRKNDKGFHYFIANLTPNDVDVSSALAIDFANAMWFNPMTGERFAAETANGKVRVCLRSGESLILQTFSKAEDLSLLPKQPNTLNTTLAKSLTDGWTLHFTESAPAVEGSFPINTLTTWEKLSNENAKITMGTGVYECTFKMKASELKGNNCWALDLGDVRESARVFINDKEIGCAWAVPYVLTFPQSALKKGTNTLRIEVTNLPANRIADLDRKGVAWRKFNEINVVDLNYKKTTYASWAPVPSGLNSSVTLYRLQ